MSKISDQLLNFATNFAKTAAESLDKSTKEKKEKAKGKGKFPFWLKKKKDDSNKAEDKKLDPKAKVRNRGTVCVPAESAKDKKDHFPINDENQARNALSQVAKYKSAPPWYKGSLKSLQDLVSSKVHSKYPGIGKSSKASLELLLNKYSQQQIEIDEQTQPQIELDPPALKPGEVSAPVVKRQTDPIYFNWSSRQLADASKAGKINLNELHQSGRITDDQFDMAMTVINQPVPVKPTVKPVQPKPAPVKPVEKKWWDTPLLDKEKSTSDPDYWKNSAPKKSSFEQINTLLNKYSQFQNNHGNNLNMPQTHLTGPSVNEQPATPAPAVDETLKQAQYILKYTYHYDLGNSGPQGDGVDGQMGPLTDKAISDWCGKNGFSSLTPIHTLISQIAMGPIHHNKFRGRR